MHAKEVITVKDATYAVAKNIVFLREETQKTCAGKMGHPARSGNKSVNRVRFVLPAREKKHKISNYALLLLCESHTGHIDLYIFLLLGR